MTWRFWEPRHTLESVARQLAEGLADGTVALDEPLADEPLDEGAGPEALVLQLDVPDHLSDAEVLELIKQLSATADKDHRRHGGQGLAIRQVFIPRAAPAANEKAVRVAFQSKNDADPTEALAAVAADLRRQPDIHVLTGPAETAPKG
jgi:hypothetical protein